MSNEHNEAIVVKNVYKDFKLFYDKANTLKEKILFLKNAIRMMFYMS